MANSRETVGYPARNSSRVCPRSSESNKSWSGTRVPRNTGVPPKILGFLTTTLSIGTASCAHRGAPGLPKTECGYIHLLRGSFLGCFLLVETSGRCQQYPGD